MVGRFEMDDYLQTPDVGDNAPKSKPSAPAAPSPEANKPLDRASIKSSFQQLFTPTLAGPGPDHGTAVTGVTPFLTGPGTTPNLVTPSFGMMPMLTPRTFSAEQGAMSSPYLQAAAKEAVRREFMNMPAYFSGVGVGIPMSVPPQLQPSPGRQLVYTKDGSAVPKDVAPSAVNDANEKGDDSSEHSEARVPAMEKDKKSESSGEQSTTTADNTAAKVPESTEDQAPAQNLPMGTAPMPPYAGAPGMFLMPMMMPGGGQMLVPMGMPGMPGMPGLMAPPGMMMMAPPGMVLPMGGGPMKAETDDERKAREKEELVREFKKKTREAALVRFRQKRRERRFGKHIRYACRKELADARPRVKGRFVRIDPPSSTDSVESEQVVPQ